MREPGETAQQGKVEKRGTRAWLRPRSRVTLKIGSSDSASGFEKGGRRG